MQQGDLVWSPKAQKTRLDDFAAFLQGTRGLEFGDYNTLWRWSVEQLEDFWESIYQFFAVRGTPYQSVLEARVMPNAKWFTGATLNYAEHCFLHKNQNPAIIFANERGGYREIAWTELEQQVGSLATHLREWGIRAGDRVVGYLGNTPEAIVAFLACASIGAIWSCTSLEMGLGSIVDRFSQIEPKILFAAPAYYYNGKNIDCRNTIAQLQERLPSLEKTIILGEAFDALLTRGALPECKALPFDHPLYILYSSGTTGLPKPIVHGHGGILLEHLKQLALQSNLGAQDRFFWFTTTGWMMWNYLVSGLLVGSSIVLWDGSPTYPSPDALWQLCERARITVFGCGAAYLHGNIKIGLEPKRNFDLSALRAIGSTGSPLSLDGFSFVYQQVKPDVQLFSTSGGTDVCSAFLGGSPWTPVWAGELSCRSLGADLHAFDEHGQAVQETVGELVLTSPMPSMPLYFWNDPDNKRYLESYFAAYAGVWRHGDWVKITSRGSAIIYGRSDATINKAGVRIGTAEFYSVIEALPEVQDSLIINLEQLGEQSYMPLFVVVPELDSALEQKIKNTIRQQLSPRLVPDEIIAVAAIPRTLNGKKLELPIKKILLGADPKKVINPDAIANPEALVFFTTLAQKRQSR
ncbi:MAG: acetoacetate--CoA ligase [Deinococcales bacterium]